MSEPIGGMLAMARDFQDDRRQCPATKRYRDATAGEVLLSLSWSAKVIEQAE
jgi:hypothetical protein